MTQRLALVCATPAILQADLQSPAQLGTLLDAKVPDDWPPGEYDRAAIEWVLRELSSAPEKGSWMAWYAVRQAQGTHPATLVGAGGYFGPPDEHGSVEIGFSICAAWQKRGYATELARALVWRAAESGAVRRVYAHTLPDNEASKSVLQKSGFREIETDEPELLRFECPL
ncbi:MAG: hypothetical protein NVS9B12_07070 [Vulcanimicrobiaceae bacterium]